MEILRISLADRRQQIDEIVGSSPRALVRFGPVGMTPRPQRVLPLSRREALRLGHGCIGSKHILLRLIAEREGVAAQVLIRLGATMRRVRPLFTNAHAAVGRAGHASPADILGHPASIDARLPAMHLPAGDGMPTTEAETINADLLAFLQS